MHIPALRLGKPYASVEKVDVVGHATGEKLAEAGRTEETVLVAPLDLAAARSFRAGMGFFRDRRPDLYGPLLTSDGKTQRNG